MSDRADLPVDERPGRGLVLKRAEGLSPASVHEVEIVIFLNEDSGLLWQLQHLQKGEPRLVEIAEPLFLG